MAGLGGFASLSCLSLSASEVDDAGLAHVGSMMALANLPLRSTAVTDVRSSHIGAMDGLTDFDLGSTAITDGGLGRLAGLTGVTDLDLSQTAVGDTVIPLLLSIPVHPAITLVRTRLTDAGPRNIASPVGFRGRLVVGGPTRVEGDVRATEDANPGLTILRRYGDEQWPWASDGP